MNKTDDEISLECGKFYAVSCADYGLLNVAASQRFDPEWLQLQRMLTVTLLQRKIYSDTQTEQGEKITVKGFRLSRLTGFGWLRRFFPDQTFYTSKSITTTVYLVCPHVAMKPEKDHLEFLTQYNPLTRPVAERRNT